MGGPLTNISRVSTNPTVRNIRIFKMRASQKTEDDVPNPSGDKCLQLSKCVRLEVRTGKLVSPAYLSQPKAHFPH